VFCCFARFEKILQAVPLALEKSFILLKKLFTIGIVLVHRSSLMHQIAALFGL